MIDVEKVLPQLKTWLQKPKANFIGGRWVEGKGDVFSSENPATEEKLCDIRAAALSDVEKALEEARKSFDDGPWARMVVGERAKKLLRLADSIEAHRLELAVLESLDTGKPIQEAFEGDIPRAAQNFRFFAEFAEKESLGERFISGPDEHLTEREPLGVVALITPWNLPLYLETWKLAPALVMGNSVVMKPSELTPLTATYLFELAESLDFPKGVLNLVHGKGEGSTGEFLTSSNQVDGISFTGETSTGRAIMAKAARGPTRVSFELGGKGAAVVFSDADIEKALTQTLRGAFRNQGEICLATPRVFVEQSIFSSFVDAFVRRASTINVGNPLLPETQMGALISRDHLAKVTGYLKNAKPSAMKTGGKRPSSLEKGYFLEPTVLSGEPHGSPISREEIFGPVVSFYSFSSEEEVVKSVNDTPYGLSASVWTKDEKKALRVARSLREGLVWVNSWFVRDLRVPFGGMKRSGVGREGGKHSLDFYSEWKSICVRREP